VRDFFDQVGGQVVSPAYFRRTIHMGGDVSPNVYRINAWLARVLVRSRGLRENLGEFRKPDDTTKFLRNVAQLSWSERGPQLAAEYLCKVGIVLVVETHLARTYLDGAAILDNDGVPVIGLTLRFNRLDNFWFTLLHELAHIVLHLTDKQEAFVDNTELDPEGERMEREANRHAQEVLLLGPCGIAVTLSVGLPKPLFSSLQKSYRFILLLWRVEFGEILEITGVFLIW